MSILILFCSLSGLVDFHAILNSIEMYVPNHTSYIKDSGMVLF